MLLTIVVYMYLYDRLKSVLQEKKILISMGSYKTEEGEINKNQNVAIGSSMVLS